ncbi:hypothetical protein EVAR_55790_1 [Eumeta japonica]|uniref:Reverse transcriptase domain-containing protein n=1 Tax=Eumeta variegata TaxID=151549 RepID=A0A4C1YSR4_EUMVA|nr:hypothetical protein EVAR_55790_1 [Eumeta japonica]
MLDNGVIRLSKNPYASPVLLVKQPDDTWKFCVDFRNLNIKIILDSYPILRTEDLLMYLGKAKYFASADLISGYWKMVVYEKERLKNAFVTLSGIFEVNVVPYGLRTCQASFQRMMDTILAGIKYRNAMVNVDDVIVYVENFEEFCDALKDMFNRVRESNLMVKSSKCSFGYESVRALGYKVSEEGVKPCRKKLDAVLELEKPMTAKNLNASQSYYKKFIENYAQITFTLTRLLKKGNKFH